MLIGAFEIQIDGTFDFGALGRDALERKTRISPDIHDIGDFVVLCRLGSKEIRRIERKPGFDTALLHLGRRAIDERDGIGV